MNRSRMLHTAAFLASIYVHYKIVIQLLTSRVYSMNVFEYSWLLNGTAVISYYS